MPAYLIAETFYLSDPDTLARALELTGLAPDELETIVGRFRPNHWRFAGKLKGEVILYLDGDLLIRHHFTKRTLWTSRSSSREEGSRHEGQGKKRKPRGKLHHEPPSRHSPLMDDYDII